MSKRHSSRGASRTCRGNQLRKIAQQVHLDRVPQRAQRLDLDLTNAFAGQLKEGAQLLQSMAMTIVQSITEFDHLAFARVQRLQRVCDLVT